MTCRFTQRVPRCQDVRTAVLTSLPVSKAALEATIERTHDVSDEVWSLSPPCYCVPDVQQSPASKYSLSALVLMVA